MLILLEILIGVFHFFAIFLPVLILVAFVTLLERKEIATMQKRRGPNVLGFFGLLQPFADGLKLFVKEPVLPYSSNKYLFFISPILTFFCSVFSWSIIPISGSGSFLNLELGLLVILALSSLSSYGIIFAGWSSNSKYAFFGALRSSSQLISYEVSFTLSILPVVLLSQSVNFETIVCAQNYCWFVIPCFISALCVLISILAETSRLPFDLPEAEAELVSGYNVEYSAMHFAFFYLAEYLSILLMSAVFVLLFFGGWTILNYSSLMIFSFKLFLIVYLIIWIRVSFPRYRFDQLLQLGWKNFLPLTMGFYLFIAGLFVSEYYLLLYFL